MHLGSSSIPVVWDLAEVGVLANVCTPVLVVIELVYCSTELSITLMDVDELEWPVWQTVAWPQWPL